MEDPPLLQIALDDKKHSTKDNNWQDNSVLVHLAGLNRFIKVIFKIKLKKTWGTSKSVIYLDALINIRDYRTQYVKRVVDGSRFLYMKLNVLYPYKNNTFK